MPEYRTLITLTVRAKAVFHLEKWTRGAKLKLLENFWGVKGVCTAVLPLGVLNFRPSEIASGAFFRPFVALK